MTVAAAALPARGEDRSAWRAALLLAILVASPFWQARWGTGPDTSWGITMAERVLDGARLYTDVVETNPPLTVWLHVPPVALARLVGCAPEPLVQAWATLAVLFGLGLAGLIARRADPDRFGRLAALSPAFLGVLLLLPGNAFGEREHFGVALLLPLLALQAWRADGGRPDSGLVVSSALAASIIVLVKPYYAASVLAPALAVACRRRSARELWRPEYAIIGLVACAYLALARVLYPAYFTAVYPLLADTYLQIRVGPSRFTPYLALFALLAGVFLLIRPRDGYGALPAIVAAAATAALLPLLYQGKAWPYHAMPALMLMALALICVLARRRDAGERLWPTLISALAILATALPFMPRDRPAPALVQAIRSAGPHPSVALIGMDIASGHPLTRLGGGRWISAYCSDWVGGMAVALAARALKAGDGAKAAHYAALATGYFDAKMAEIRRARPDVIIVEENGSAAWAEALRRAGFEELLGFYRTAAASEGLSVMTRADLAGNEAQR